MSEPSRLKFTIRPCRDMVLVEKVDDILPGQSEAGIHYPESSEELVVHRVVAVGEGEHLKDGRIKEPRVKPGDLVVVRGVLSEGGPVNLLILERMRKKTCLVRECDIWATVEMKGSN